MKKRGHPFRGAIAGFFCLLGLVLFLLPLGAFDLGSILVAVLPAGGIVLGLLIGLLAPFGRAPKTS